MYLITFCSSGGGTFQTEPAEFSGSAAQSGQSNIRPVAASSLRILQQRGHPAGPDSAHAPLRRAPGTLSDLNTVMVNTFLYLNLVHSFTSLSLTVKANKNFL